MGWFDRFAYNIAPLFGHVGKGISDASQDIRMTEAGQQLNAAPDLQRFAEIQTPENIYSPEHLIALEKLRTGKRAELQQQAAAPVAKMLADFEAQGFGADPSFSGKDWVKGMATTLGGMTEDEYETMRSGAIPGTRKTSLPVTSADSNPVVADLLQKAEARSQMQGDVARVLDNRATPTARAAIAMNKDYSSGLENFLQSEGYRDKNTNTMADRDQVSRLNQFLIEADKKTYGTGDPGTFGPAMTKDVRDFMSKEKITSADAAKVADEFLKTQMERQAKIPFQWKEGTIGTGTATKKYKFAVNPHGEEIPGTKIEVTNHAPQPGTTDKEELRQRRKDFQNDLTYLRGLQRTVATGGKGMIMIDGVPTSFDGTAESLATLKSMLADHETNMYATYPTEMAERQPKQPKMPEGNGRQVKIDSKGQPQPAAFQMESKTMPGYWRDVNGVWWDSNTKRPK